MHVMLQVARVDHGEDVGHVQVVRVPGEVNLGSNNINITALVCKVGGHPPHQALTQLISV